MKVEKSGKKTVFTVEKQEEKKAKKPRKQEQTPVENKQEIEKQEVD